MAANSGCYSAWCNKEDGDAKANVHDKMNLYYIAKLNPERSGKIWTVICYLQTTQNLLILRCFLGEEGNSLKIMTHIYVQPLYFPFILLFSDASIAVAVVVS